MSLPAVALPLFTLALAVAGPIAAQQAEYGQLPLYFLANQGQIEAEQVDYYLIGARQTVYFTAAGLTIAQRHDQSGQQSRWVVKLDFVDANPLVQPCGVLPQKACINYFIGPQKDWHTAIPSYSALLYKDLWPGIDLEFHGAVGRLKYQFIVHPGANPDLIQLRYRGVSGLTVLDSGALQITTPAGSFQDHAPTSQCSQVAVPTRFDLRPDDQSTSFGFALGDYDPAQTLIIDPALLMYCGYLGGSGVDTGFGIALDEQNRSYITGTTWSNELSFPVTVGPDLISNGPSSTGDAFVARINAQGTALEYCGYIGGSHDDWGRAIAVDRYGAAYVTGETKSNQSSFPVLVGPDLSFNSGNGEFDAFIAKINPQGTALEYCGYLGGIDDDRASGVAVDEQGRAYLTGYSKSDENTFPVLVGPDLSHNIGPDAFVARVNAAGTSLDYCGYIGGMSFDVGEAIAVDASGRAYITGNTYSNEGTFPVLLGPDLSYNLGWDAFVARINPDGSGLEYCGYIGGAIYDTGHGIAVDAQNRAYVAGYTYSNELTFPVFVGPDLQLDGYNDAFVARLSPTGQSLEYCGYIGGAAFDYGSAIAVDSLGNAYLSGTTTSNETSFPVLGGPSLVYGGLDEAFVARVNSVGTRLNYCGYIGGAGNERSLGISVDAVGNAYLTGDVASDEGTFPVLRGPDLTHNGERDAFVAKVEAIFMELRLSPQPLEAGQFAHAMVRNGAANADSFLVYSLVGPGQTTVHALNLIIDLLQPVQIGSQKTSDAAGDVQWDLLLPPSTAGLDVWVQALQMGMVSNVVITTIQ